MAQERWEHVQGIFDAALDLDPEERSTFLEAACAGDPDVRSEVDSLLDAFDDAGRFDALVSGVSVPLVVDAEPPPGWRVGPYRVLKEIGRGGMGVVYLAERADGQFDRRVALKVMRLAIGTDTTSERFRNERQILAQLTHPNIARLYDGGVVEAGPIGEPQPYFAMEYVQGIPIDVYCDDERLDVGARLGLFISVCAAVQYAHRNLVVHRDLKPSNILVTGEGEVKLLDFGIAKLADDSSMDVTQSADWAMTPAYASPEQIRREPITTATDVYSLGVILYELLSGRRPYEVSGSSPAEVERTICEVEPRRPSTGLRGIWSESPARTPRPRPEDVALDRNTTPEKLRRRLEGDLDNIILKALQKAPSERYASAEQLLGDITRHLNGLPITARPDSLTYRASKFVRRHRAGVIAAVLFVLVLFGGLAGTAWQARRATIQARIAADERDRARVETARAEQVSSFLASLFEASDPMTALGDTLNAYQILERGAARIEAELADQPEVRATLMSVLSQVYVSLGDYERAERFAVESLGLRRALFGDHDPETAKGLFDLAGIRQSQGDAAAAESLYAQTLEIRRQALGTEHPDLAAVLDEIGYVHLYRGSYAEAEGLFREALDQRRRLYGDEHEAVASSLVSVGTVLYHRGQIPDAETMLREALAIRRRTLAPTHPDLAAGVNNLAVILDEQGRPAEAEPLYREALGLRIRVLGPEHPRVAVNMSNLGQVLTAMGRFEEADALLRDALALTRRTLGDDHPRVGLQLNNLGRLLHDKGDLAEAELRLRESLAVRMRRQGPEHPEIAGTMSNLAAVLKDRGMLAESATTYRDAALMLARFLRPDHPNLANVNSHMGNVLTRLGEYDEAESLLIDAHHALLEEVGADDRRTRIAVQHLAELYEAWNRPDDAAPWREQLGGR